MAIPVYPVILLLPELFIVGDALIDGPASVADLPDISLVQVCVWCTARHHTRRWIVTFSIADLAVVQASNLRKFVFNIVAKGDLELCYDPNNWMALVLELLPYLVVDLSDHAREVVQRFLLICFIGKAPAPLTIDIGTEVLRKVERVLQRGTDLARTKLGQRLVKD